MTQQNNNEAVENTNPQKTWFIERGDGVVFAFNEIDAHETLKSGNWKRNDFKIVGVSSGEMYWKTLKESRGKSIELKNEVDELEKIQERYYRTEERFKFDDLLDDDDIKMKKVREKIQEIEDKLEPLISKLNEVSKNIHQAAFNAELKVARGNIEYPSNSDIVTPGASPAQRNKIISGMGK